MDPLCIYHGNCADGFTSAWIVHLALKGQVELYPATHGKPPPDVTGRLVIMVDFSYKKAVIESMASQANMIIVLDHHATAVGELSGAVPLTTRWDLIKHMTIGTEQNNLFALFDMTRSGAQLTWDYFYPDEERFALVDYVGDRDLWKFELNGSREVSEYLCSHDYDLTTWTALVEELEDPTRVGQIIDIGAALTKKHMKDIRELLAITRRTMIIGGQIVPVANMSYIQASDAANLMSEGQPFAATYYDKPGSRVFSLRSKEHGSDVSKIAAYYGGGGHAHAAGFSAPEGWEGDIIDSGSLMDHL